MSTFLSDRVSHTPPSVTLTSGLWHCLQVLLSRLSLHCNPLNRCPLLNRVAKILFPQKSLLEDSGFHADSALIPVILGIRWKLQEFFNPSSKWYIIMIWFTASIRARVNITLIINISVIYFMAQYIVCVFTPWQRCTFACRIGMTAGQVMIAYQCGSNQSNWWQKTLKWDTAFPGNNGILGGKDWDGSYILYACD